MDWIVAWNPDEITDGEDGSRDFYTYQIENSGGGDLQAARIGQGVNENGFVSDSFFSFSGCDFDNDNWLSDCSTGQTWNDDGTETTTGSTLTDLQSLFAGLDAEGHSFGFEVDDGLNTGHPGPVMIEASSGLVLDDFANGLTSVLPANEESGIFGGRGSAPVPVNWNATASNSDVQWNSIPFGVKLQLLFIARASDTRAGGNLGAGVPSRRKRVS